MPIVVVVCSDSRLCHTMSALACSAEGRRTLSSLSDKRGINRRQITWYGERVDTNRESVESTQSTGRHWTHQGAELGKWLIGDWQQELAW